MIGAGVSKVLATGVAKEGGAMQGVGAELLRQISEGMKGKTHIPAWVFGKRAKKGKPEPEGVDITNAWVMAGVAALALYCLVNGKFPNLSSGIANFTSGLTGFLGPGAGAQSNLNSAASTLKAYDDNKDAGAKAKTAGDYTFQCWVDYSKHSLQALQMLVGFCGRDAIDGDAIVVSGVSQASSDAMGMKLGSKWQTMDNTGKKVSGPGPV